MGGGIHGKPSFDYMGCKNWDTALQRYRRRVDLAEEQSKMKDQRMRPSRARNARQAEKAAVLQWLNKARGKQVTRAQAMTYWRTLNALDARRIEWEAAEVPFDRDDYLGLATNCNGALIKDVLKQELDDTNKYSEASSHVQAAAAFLLGMHLDATDVPWLIKYVNAAKPMAVVGGDDDKHATDISRVTLFGLIQNTAFDHGRREAVQACANSLRLLRDPWVRNNTREWLERVKITPDAAPPARVKHYNQAPTAGQTTTTNGPAGR
jgi:hypothetical protein